MDEAGGRKRTPRQVWLDDQMHALSEDLAEKEKSGESVEELFLLGVEPEARLRDLVEVLWRTADRCEHTAPNKVQRLEWDGRFKPSALLCDECAVPAWENRQEDPCQICHFKTSNAWWDLSLPAPDGSGVVRVRTRFCDDCAGMHSDDIIPPSGPSLEDK